MPEAAAPAPSWGGPRPGAFRCAVGPVQATLRWVEWGPPEGDPVVCVHGLTRNGRDFDVLARALASAGRRVICPDVFGRGFSDWLPDGQLYVIPTYALAFRQFLASLPGRCDWVGTSMGGLIGMAVAAMPEVAPRRMVLNDIGPFLPAQALGRIAAYMALRPRFRSVEEVEQHLRMANAGFGRLTDEAWRAMAESSARMAPDGGVVLHYDPAIAEPMLGSAIVDIDLWPHWEAVRGPVLVLRGAESDLLQVKTAEAMALRPETRLVTFADCAHAPALMDAAQVGVVAEFLA